MVKLYTSGRQTLREFRMFCPNARNIAFNLKVFCVYTINIALWLQYSSWVKLNPDILLLLQSVAVKVGKPENPESMICP